MFVYVFGDFGNKLGQKETKQEKSLQFAELDKAGRRSRGLSEKAGRSATSESRQEIDKRAETVLHAYTKTR
ncbi:hypothetical protein ACJV45_06745 [Gardnerella sp. Marseille-Q9181]|uniref:hypothetical protein n=1 Tax=Gardnerella sp. Marseille-Q9181 TaxID=3383029 RepID=UPI003AF7CD49